MSPVTTTIAKKTTRTRKTTSVPTESLLTGVETSMSSQTRKSLDDSFETLLKTIIAAKEEYGTLQKNIVTIKEGWEKEQKLHEEQLLERNRQEDVAKKREKELYDYETLLKRRQDEDSFLEKKMKWEKELQARKEEIEQDKKELDILRKQVAGFEQEVKNAVETAVSDLQKELTEEFVNEKKLREQEIKSEKELLVLRITTITQENARQQKEIEAIKASLEDATRQLKDVAVKVIESGSGSNRQPATQENKTT